MPLPFTSSSPRASRISSRQNVTGSSRRTVAAGRRRRLVDLHPPAANGLPCSPDRWRLAEMLRRMAGATDRVRDGLTHWLTPLTGAYYTVPAVEALARFAPTDG